MYWTVDGAVEETLDGQSYSILHDVITRCTFLAATENHRALLITECISILMFDCIRVNWANQKRKSTQLAYVSLNSIGNVSKNRFDRLFDKNVLVENSRLYNDENFQNEWDKAELYFTNEIDVENETVNWPF